MKSFLASIITGGILTCILPVYCQDAPLILPGWFWDSPQVNGVMLAVGYSPPYIDSDHAFDGAFSDASSRIYRDMLSIAKGNNSAARTPYGRMQISNTVTQQIDSLGYEEFLYTLVHIDSVIVPGVMRIVLISNQPFTIRTNVSSISPLNLNPVTSGRIAMGASSKFHQESSSWIEAEKQARVHLALSKSQFKSKHENLYGRFEDHTGSIDQVTDVVMRNVQTKIRRIDPETGARIVWVSGSINSSMRNK